MSAEALATYKAHLDRLHALILEGKGDSPEYEDVCDLMDAPWDQLTEEGRAEAKRYSVELWRRHDASVGEAAPETPSP